MLTNDICEKLNINMTDKEKNKIIDKAHNSRWWTLLSKNDR